MRFFISTVAIISVLALGTNAAIVCTAVCRPVKPVCPVGEAAGGSEGCWGCCVPSYTPTRVYTLPVVSPTPVSARQDSEGGGDGDGLSCTQDCKLEKPICKYNEKISGSEGCWGCCLPI